MWCWAVAVAIAFGSGMAPAATASSLEPSTREVVALQPANSFAQQRWFYSQAPVKVWSSRVGKGKSFGVCTDALRRCFLIAGYKAAITRQTRVSLRETIQETLLEILGASLFQAWWSETKSTLFLPAVRCDDGRTRQSKIVLFGWQDPAEALSTQYGLIALEQAEQMDRTPLAFARTRVRHGDPWMLARAAQLGIRAQQIGLVCNADDPEHWINLDFQIEEKGMREERAEDGALAYEVILSQDGDNEENLTDEYRGQLEALRGTVWYERLVGGRWSRAEGLVYGQCYDPARHLIQRPAEWTATVTRECSAIAGHAPLELGKRMPPASWPRLRGWDFGVNHPTVIGWYAERPDGAIVRYREVYGRGKSPSDWASLCLRLEAEELEALRRDCENEDAVRAAWPYLRRFRLDESWSDHELGWRTELNKSGVWTAPAEKDITAMVLSVTQAFNDDRLLLVTDALVEQDPGLKRDKLPTTITQEIARYRWPKRRDGGDTSDKRLDAPVDRDNHALDEVGYVCLNHFRARRVAVF